MPNRNYARGANFERQVVRDQEVSGWIAGRNGGSHGEADVWAMKAVEGGKKLIQCKLGRISRAERARLGEVAFYAGATAWIASRPRRGVIEYEQVRSVLSFGGLRNAKTV